MESDTKVMEVATLLEYATTLDNIRLKVEEIGQNIAKIKGNIPTDGRLIQEKGPYYGKATKELTTFFQSFEAHMNKLNIFMYTGEEFILTAVDKVELSQEQLIEVYAKMLGQK